MAIEDALSLYARKDIGRSSASRHQGGSFDISSALGRPGFYASELPLPETKLRIAGRIDAVQVLPNRVVRLTDYKTGRAFDAEGQLLESVSLQLRLYALALAELIPTAKIELQVVNNERTVFLPFDNKRKSETLDWLNDRLHRLPIGTVLPSTELTSFGKQCRTCNFRPSCPLFRDSIREYWNRTDNSFPLPLDIGGTILSVQRSERDSITFKLRDRSDRIVKVHRLDPHNDGLEDVKEGDDVWFFNLASIEPQATASGWRHPRNFYELPSLPSERRAWTFTPFLA